MGGGGDELGGLHSHFTSTFIKNLSINTAQQSTPAGSGCKEPQHLGKRKRVH